MSEISRPHAEKITQHPLETVLKDLEYLVNSLAMELEVALCDRKVHQDLLRRIQKVTNELLYLNKKAECLCQL